MLKLGHTASPQFSDTTPTIFRVISVSDAESYYDGWIWLDGYQLNDQGEAVTRRSVWVCLAGLSPLTEPAVPQPTVNAGHNERRLSPHQVPNRAPSKPMPNSVRRRTSPATR